MGKFVGTMTRTTKKLEGLEFVTLPKELQRKWKTVHLFWDMDCLVVVPVENKDVIARLSKEVQSKAKEIKKTVKDMTKDVVANTFLEKQSNKKNESRNKNEPKTKLST